MKRPAASSWSPAGRNPERPATVRWRGVEGSQRGLLLIEAVLAAVAIAAALVFLTRGLSGQLKTIQALQDREALGVVMRDALVRQEAERLFHRQDEAGVKGAVESGTGVYEWTLAAAPCEGVRDAQGRPLAVSATLTAERADPPGRSGSVQTLWPIGWITQ